MLPLRAGAEPSVLEEPSVVDDTPAFPVVNFRGYDRVAVDARIVELERKLADARHQVEAADAKALQTAGELSEAHRQLREAERPTYTGLGSRIEQLLRSAEEQSSEVISQANAQAADALARAKLAAGQLRARAENEVAELLATRPRQEDLAVCHGDLCVPNVLFDPGTCEVTGVIDTDRLGVADRWADLAIITRSLAARYNPQYGPWAADRLLDRYRVPPDPAKIAFYRLLDEFW